MRLKINKIFGTISVVAFVVAVVFNINVNTYEAYPSLALVNIEALANEGNPQIGDRVEAYTSIQYKESCKIIYYSTCKYTINSSYNYSNTSLCDYAGEDY